LEELKEIKQVITDIRLYNNTDSFGFHHSNLRIKGHFAPPRIGEWMHLLRADNGEEVTMEVTGVHHIVNVSDNNCWWRYDILLSNPFVEEQDE